MKKLFLFCSAACLCAVASAQKVYFLYLQSDNQTPFYVRIGDKIHSSANSGYLVLPNLTDSTYTFGLGLAKSSAAEAKFSVRINQNDKGYLIKKFEDGLVLFDIQDQSIVKANAEQKDNTVYEVKTDRFSSILSKAAGDPNLLKVPVAKKEEPAKPKPVEKEKEVITAKAEEIKPAEKQVVVDTVRKEPETITAKVDTKKQEAVGTDIVTTQQTASGSTEIMVAQPTVQVERKEDIAVQTTIDYKPSVIRRFSESSTTEGFGAVYFDKRDNGTDTIRILIPAPKVRLVSGTEVSSSANLQVRTEKIEAPIEAKMEEPANTKKETVADAAPKNKTNCKSIASDKDFLKLRKNMAAKDNEDAMLDEARKDFRNRCYSVEQVRYLSTLFLTSASKYQFFDAAYENVSDKNNFTSLGSEIKDEHYTKRFKALIGE